MKSFDLKVHHRDRTGSIVKANPYKLRCKGGAQWYERDGLKYHMNGELMEGQEKLMEEMKNAEVKAAQDAKMREGAEKEALKKKLEAEILSKSKDEMEAKLQERSKEIEAQLKAEYEKKLAELSKDKKGNK